MGKAICTVHSDPHPPEKQITCLADRLGRRYEDPSAPSSRSAVGTCPSLNDLAVNHTPLNARLPLPETAVLVGCGRGSVRVYIPRHGISCYARSRAVVVTAAPVLIRVEKTGAGQGLRRDGSSVHHTCATRMMDCWLGASDVLGENSHDSSFGPSLLIIIYSFVCLVIKGSKLHEVQYKICNCWVSFLYLDDYSPPSSSSSGMMAIVCQLPVNHPNEQVASLLCTTSSPPKLLCQYWQFSLS
jgi:hypothetical protein